MHAKDVAIVHGPPGTGKTTTLVEAIYETLHRENQVMVCAQSNMAVDWISEKLVDRGVPVLRIGNPTRVNDKMLAFTYERRFESHPDYPQLWSIRKAIRELYGRSRKGAERENIRQKINSLKDRATELEIRINEQTVYHDNHSVPLTHHEFFTLLYLAQHPSWVLSKEQIYEAVWKADPEQCGAAANVVYSLRWKIGDGYIETVVGSGYRFVG